MNPEQIQALVNGTVSAALAEQELRLRQQFAEELNAVRSQVDALQIVAPNIVTYEKIDTNVKCDVRLDIVKSVPSFEGVQDKYVSWRQAALDAYEIFRRYKGSEAHYEAVAILRNKVCGAARSVLTSHNTVLNIDAIIARLDCTYADKTSLRVLRQQLEMVRQGDLGLMEYYDEVERKLTLVTNKIVMTHDEQAATILNNEVRSDALHAFMSGLKKSLKVFVLPAQPKDLTSALALAREAENSLERSMFAASYAKTIADRSHPNEISKQGNRQQPKPNKGQGKNPHYIGKQDTNNKDKNGQTSQSQPMDIDPSMSHYRQPTNWGKTQSAANVSGTHKRL
ncbi:hypothetical protein KR215_003225, partial [Drosophila sulfurigaster]